MENKFEDELIKIEKLLNKIDSDLTNDHTKTDFTTFFKNMDKTFEIYNICLEELCGQLYLLELSSHSKVFRKLYHHYKHQLYNIMKYQLTLQKDLHVKVEEEKVQKSKNDTLKQKLKGIQDKNEKLLQTIDDQKVKIEKLIISKNQLTEKNKLKEKIQEKRNSKFNINFDKDMMNQFNVSKENSQEFNDEQNDNENDIVQQIDELMQTYDMSEQNPQVMKEHLQKLLKDIDNQKKKYDQVKVELQNQMKNQQSPNNCQKVEKCNQMVETSMVLYSENQYQFQENRSNQLQKELDELKEEYQASNARQTAQISELQEQNEQLVQELQVKEENLNSLEFLNEELRNELDQKDGLQSNFEQKIQKLDHELVNKKKDFKNLKQYTQELEDVNKTIQEEIQEISEKEKRQSIQEAEMKTLIMQNTEIQNRLQELEDKEISKDYSIDENLQKLLDNKQKKIDIYEKELAKILKEKKSNENKYDDLFTEYQQLKQNYNDLILKFKKQGKILSNFKEHLDKNNINVSEINVMKKSNLSKKFDKKNQIVHKNSQLKTSLKKSINSKKSVQSKIVKQTIKKNSSNNKKNSKLNQDSKIQSNSEQQIQDQDQNIVYDERSSQQNSQEYSQEQNSNEMINNSQSQENSNEQENQEYEDEENLDMNIDDYLDMNVDQDDDERIAKQLLKQMTVEQLQFLRKKMAMNEPFEFQELIDQNQQLNQLISITCHRGIQTKYYSPIDFILQQKDEVFCKESDFEKIKLAIDVLSQIIGFNSMEDLNEERIDRRSTSQFSHFKKTSRTKDNKLMPRFASQLSKVKKKNFAEFIQKKEIQEENSLENDFQIDEDLKNQKENFDMQKFTESLSKKPKQYIVPKSLAKQKKSKSPQVKHEKYEITKPKQSKSILDDWQQDYIVQKTRVLTNDNKNQQIQVVEYIRIPKELHVSQPTLNPLNMKQEFKKIRSFEDRLLNQFEKQEREKEKFYFQMFLKIKNRYKYCPEKLIKIYKIYFNKVPSFEKNLNDNYDPELFLFNYEQFKLDFKGIIQRHQICGAMCVHLRRFYEKIHQLNHPDRQLLKMKKTIIDKLPELLTDEIHIEQENLKIEEQQIIISSNEFKFKLRKKFKIRKIKFDSF